MILADIDMKQKIKEVRDKFLSNNQIEDIRQNITLGVEERLKFLNSEQIKVVELLEEKHRELDIAIQAQTRQIDEQKKAVEAVFEIKISDLLEKHEQQSIKLQSQSEKLITEQAELEKRIDEKFKNALKGQLAFMDDNLAQLSTEQSGFKIYLESMETNEQLHNCCVVSFHDGVNSSVLAGAAHGRGMLGVRWDIRGWVLVLLL